MNLKSLDIKKIIVNIIIKPPINSKDGDKLIPLNAQIKYNEEQVRENNQERNDNININNEDISEKNFNFNNNKNKKIVY